MKLIIFDPDEKPKEFEVADYRAAEEQIGHAHYGDSVWVTFNDDGTVRHRGRVDEMRAENYVEKLEQIYFCEGCNSEGFVEYPEGADVMSVIAEIGENHARLRRACAFKFGTSKIRVRGEGTADEEWVKVTGKVRV